jgi:Uma2 family endonuclease
MATVLKETVPPETLADLLEHLGGVPLERILLRPPPGMATEQDVIAAGGATPKRLCELVDNVLVEKAMGTKEALLAILIGHFLLDYLEEHPLGLVLGADGALRLRLGLVRIPDVSFISWDRLPGGELPDEPIAPVVPDLAVEVLSKGNTKREMKRKLQEYFEAEVRLVWIIDPKTQTAEAYTTTSRKQQVRKNQVLHGGEVLPGFTLPLQQLFARARRPRGSR